VKSAYSKRFFGILVVVCLALAVCKVPVGLGSSVDTSAPVINISDKGPVPGAYISGTERIYIEATDDGAIKSVVVEYWYYVRNENGELEQKGPEPGPVGGNQTDGYYVDIDTTGMADGTLTAIVTVTDSSGKPTVTPKLIYTVKNQPPTVNMQIPRPKTVEVDDSKVHLVNEHDPDKYPSVVSDSYLMGTYEDIAGVAKDYPWIKFWKDGEEEPTDYKENAGWGNVSSPGARDRGNGWVRADEGFVESSRDAKGGSFRYHLRERQSTGEAYKEDTDHKLPAGFYRVKIKAKDTTVTGHEVEWPRDAYANEPPDMLVELLLNGTPPVISWNSPEHDQLYHRVNFTLDAEATKMGDAATSIMDMYFAVTGKDKKEVILKRWTGTSPDFPTQQLNFTVQLEKTYYNVKEGEPELIPLDSESELPSEYHSYVTFTDGNFNFSVVAYDDIGARQSVPLSLYIDKQAPKTEITRVSPYFSQDNIALTATADNPNNNPHDGSGPDPYRRWTVNGTIQIDVNYTDNRGSAIDPVEGYEKFKYLVLKNTDISESAFTTWKEKPENQGKTFGDYLYQHDNAMFFEDVKAHPKPVPPGVTPNGNPMSMVDGSDGAYTLTWQTHTYDAAAATTSYRIWAYIVAMDNAGNTSYQKMLLYIDQDTDKPGIMFGTISDDGTTFMDDKYLIRFTVTDDDGLSADSVQFRYARNDAERAQYASDDARGWKELPAQPSVDGLTIDITDLTLLKIACAYLNHPYEDTHIMDPVHKGILGDEKDTKYIQVRATDNDSVKVYTTDGKIPGTSIFMPFTMDLTYPEVVASTTDLSGTVISRDDASPFGAPEKDGAYKEFNFAYGDIVEQNLKSITVKIDGKETEPFLVTDADIQDYTPTQPGGTGFAVWKAVQNNWDGELRWRIPMADIFDELTDGSHTFEISFVDKVPQITTQSLTFFSDKDGPEISLIVPGEKIYLSDQELINFPENVLPDNRAALTRTAIMDTKAKLIGTFTDSFSPVFAVNENESYSFRITGIDKIAGTNTNYDSDWKTVPILTITDSKSVSWQIDLDDSLPNLPSLWGGTLADGTYRLSLRVKDSRGNGKGTGDALAGQNGGPGFENNLAFRLDSGAPVLTVSNLGRFVRGDVVITGTITGTSGVKSLSVMQDETELAVGGDDVAVPKNITLSPTVDMSTAYTITIPASELSEGAYTLVISATGASGKIDTKVRTFTFDSTSPSVDFATPAAGINVTSDYTNRDHTTGSAAWPGGIFRVLNSEAWVTGTPKISGTAEDTNGIKSISYHLGKLNENDGNRDTVYAAATNWTSTGLGTNSLDGNWTGGLYYWTFATPINGYLANTAMIDKDSTGNRFFIPLYVRVEDQASNMTVVQYRIYVDPDADMPGVSITTPNNNDSVGGEVRISGTANDNNMVQAVEIRITPTLQGSGDSVLSGKLLNDSYYKDDLDEWAYGANPSNASDRGWIKASLQGPQDTVVPWFYTSNKDGLLSPVSDQPRPVTIEVRAVDTKDLVNKVPDLKGGIVSITINFDAGVPTIDPPEIKKTGLDDRTYADGIRVSGGFKMTTTVRDEGGISSIKARASGGTGYIEIVKDGAEVINIGDSLGNASGTTWAISTDIPGREPKPELVTSIGNSDRGWRFMLTNITGFTVRDVRWGNIDHDYTDTKNYEAGTWIRLKYDADLSGGTLAGYKANGGIQVTTTNPSDANWNTQFFEYDLEFTVDTIGNANLTYGKTGNFTLELQVYDNNKLPAAYNTNGTYTLGIDNFYPDATITTQYNASTANFYVMGSAKDFGPTSGNIQGLERMLVYFERDGVYYNAAGKTVGESATDGSTIPAMTTMPNVRDTTQNNVGGDTAGLEPNVPSFTHFPVLVEKNKGQSTAYWYSPHAMVIDNQELAENADGDGDKTYAEMWQRRGSEMDWQARLDTTEFGDGPLTVHYIVMDQAGNATHYAEKIYIGNNKPLIREITLGTDLNGAGGVGDVAGEYGTPITVGTTAEGNREITTNFRVRNSRFGLKLDTLYGNNEKHYNVYYVTRQSGLIPSTEMERGKVYTISPSVQGNNGIGPGNTEWTRYGALNNNAGTTFVASGSALDTNDAGNATTGWVYGYSDSIAATRRTGTFSTLNGGENSDIVDDILFEAVHFGTSLIPDSAKVPDPANPGSLLLQHDRYFIIKVYDTTVPREASDTDETFEAKQLAHVALINIDVDNIDGQTPIISIDPFYWNSVSDNSLYENSRANGHIELEDDLPAIFNQATGLRDKDPKVSGKVSFRGTSFDNNSIGSIYFRIVNFADASAPNNATIDGNTYHRAATYNGTWTPVDRFAANGWKFSIINNTINQDGHRVDWQLDFDSRRITNVASLDNILTVVARDTTANESTIGTVQTTSTTKTSYYRFDVVPYISSIETPNRNQSGLKNNTIRSADGRYSVRQGSSGADNLITVSGFNLPGSGNNARILNTTANNTTYSGNPSTVPAGTAVTTTAVTGTGIEDNTRFTMPSNFANSGYLTVVVNSIGNLNNINNNDAKGSYTLKASTDGSDQENMPNREADRYQTKNITLKDDRYLQFFKAVDAGISNSGYPDMIMNDNNPVFGYVNTSGGPNSNPGTAAGTGAGTSYPGYAMPQRREVNAGSINANNVAAEVYTEYLIKGSNWDAMGMARDGAGRYIHATTFDREGGTLNLVYDRFAEIKGDAGGGWSAGIAFGSTGGAASWQNENNAVALEAIAYGAAINITAANTAAEYVYTINGTAPATHPLVLTPNYASVNTAANRVLVNSTGGTTVTNLLRYVRRLEGTNRFTLNTNSGNNANVDTYGADCGGTTSFYVTRPVAVTTIAPTGNTAGTRTFTIGTNHGLQNGDVVWYITNVANTTTAATQGWVANMAATTIQIRTNNPANGGTATYFNTTNTVANQCFIYPERNRIQATRSEERYYQPTTNLTEDLVVNVSGDQYKVKLFNGTMASNQTTFTNPRFKLYRVSDDSIFNTSAAFTINGHGGLALNRYQYPKIVALGSPTTDYAAYYMFYFDAAMGELAFRNFRIGNSAANAGGGTTIRLATSGADQGGTNYGGPYSNLVRNAAGLAYTAANGSTDLASISWNTGRQTAATGASKYFDFGVTGTTNTGGRVVFVYYDEDAGRLKMKYSNADVDGTQTVTWVDSEIVFPDYVGMYVSMVLEGNAVHIAAMDANDSDLMYIYVPNYTQTAFTAVTVDQYGAMGNWTQIKMQGTGANIRPYISYLSMTEVGSRDSLRLAYPKSQITSTNVPKGVDANGYTTGEWEYMTVPALTPPQGGVPKFQKVNLGFRTDGQPVLGYLGNNIEFVYRIGE